MRSIQHICGHSDALVICVVICSFNKWCRAVESRRVMFVQ